MIEIKSGNQTINRGSSNVDNKMGAWMDQIPVRGGEYENGGWRMDGKYGSVGLLYSTSTLSYLVSHQLSPPPSPGKGNRAD
jgi:hypothetical protein